MYKVSHPSHGEAVTRMGHPLFLEFAAFLLREAGWVPRVKGFRIFFVFLLMGYLRMGLFIGRIRGMVWLIYHSRICRMLV